MHVSGLTVDLNWLIQLIFTAFILGLGLLHVVKNTASKYFVVDDSSFHIPPPRSTVIDNTMPGSRSEDLCFVCSESASKKCSGCKSVRYCSQKCQSEHWRSEHNKKCKRASIVGGKKLTKLALVPSGGIFKTYKQPPKILFPYEEFVKYFNWDNPGFPPCGLLNCGNSCFANVVLQCLTYTRPLVAYLLEKGHRRECRRNDWCFLCEFEIHIERATRSTNSFSPLNILSRLPSIGGNLGYGKQEDAHEFMRFAIDTMQSVCLDEYGGEKALDASVQETTLIQHIFGGHLQSQVICTNCNMVSNQYESMMDLTVEIHGDAASLEECLDQFTAKEWLDGDNMYKCDGCNDYVTAWKRLTVRRAPNILTIALKRFQSGRFGKLNKRIAFPEILDFSPYMTEPENAADVYKLYAVVVHVDMLNASYFGHYICYIKDFSGNWYRIDDCKVICVGLEEVLSEGAYMLFYSRMCARTSSDMSSETPKVDQKGDVAVEGDHCALESGQNIAPSEVSPISINGLLPTNGIILSKKCDSDEETTSIKHATSSENPMDVCIADFGSSSSTSEVGRNGNEAHHVKSDDPSTPCTQDGSIFSNGNSRQVSSSCLQNQNGCCKKYDLSGGVRGNESSGLDEEMRSESEPENSNCSPVPLSSPESEIESGQGTEMTTSDMIPSVEESSLEPVHSNGSSACSLRPEIVMNESVSQSSKCTKGAAGKSRCRHDSNGFIYKPPRKRDEDGVIMPGEK